MQLGINMLGYGEIQADPYPNSHLMEAFTKELNLKMNFSGDDSLEIFLGSDESTPFLGAILKDKSHVYLALKEFLKKDRSI